jgi:hypothetical protein
LVAATILILVRAWIFDLIAWFCIPMLFAIDDRRRVRWTAWMLDVRLSLLGNRRPPSAVLRKHLSTSLHLPEHLAAKVRTLLDAFDDLLFGRSLELSPEHRLNIREIWRELTVARLRKTRKIENQL